MSVVTIEYGLGEKVRSALGLLFPDCVLRFTRGILSKTDPRHNLFNLTFTRDVIQTFIFTNNDIASDLRMLTINNEKIFFKLIHKL